MKKEILKRTYIAMACIMVGVLVILFKTIQIGIVEGPKWKSQGQELSIIERKLTPRRGDIYADDRSLLATTVTLYDVRLDLNTDFLTDTYFDRHVDSLAYYMTRYVLPQYSASEYAQKLRRRRRSGERYMLVKRKVPVSLVEQIKDFPILNLGKYKGGLILESHTERSWPFGRLARRTIGESRENSPDYGLEGYYDEELSGQEGYRKERKISGNIYVPISGLTELEPEDGLDVYTTLNIDLQDIAHSSLERSLSKYDADFGCAVVMEVETGDIKAMANLKKVKEGDYRDIENFAVGGLFEPGSTFKLATMLALLEDHDIDIHELVDLNYGKMKVGRHYIKDSEKHDFKSTTIAHAFEISSNVGMARLASHYYDTRAEQTKFLKTISKFGLDMRTGVPVIGERDPKIKDSANVNQTYTIPWMSHGYELSLTPLQILTFYNTVANDGVWVKPRLVKSIQDGTKVIERNEVVKARRRIAAKKNIDSVKVLLEGVVTNGTVDHLKTDKYSFAGKTGTSKVEYWKKYQRNKYIGSFAGYFPADDPKYSCYVMVYNPKGPVYYGGYVAAPVFRDIADFCFNTQSDLIKKTHKNIVPTTIASSELPFYTAGYADDFSEIARFLGLKIGSNTSSHWAVLMPNQTEPSLETRDVDKEVIPNVVGMTFKDALYILENKNFTVRTRGKGKVIKQMPAPGTGSDAQRIILQLG